MTTNNDLWGESIQVDQPDSSQEKPAVEVAPFTLISCKNTFDTQGSYQRKFHLIIYWIIIFIYAVYLSLITASIALFPDQTNRIEFFSVFVEFAIIISTLRRISELRKTTLINNVPYIVNMCSTIILRAFFSLIIFLVATLSLEYYIQSYNQQFWHFDDMIMLMELVYILVLWRGSLYFRKES